MKRSQVRGSALPLAASLVAALTVTCPPAILEARQPELEGGSEIATATVHAGGVDLQPEVSYRQAIVTVSGNGMIFRRESPAGGDPSIGIFDPAGQLLPDGVYKWQLQLVPDAATAELLRAAAGRSGGIAPLEWQAKTGTFAIHGGQVVAPDLVEPRPARRAADSSAGALSRAMTSPPSAARARPADSDGFAGAATEAAAPRQSQVWAPAAAGPNVRQADPERSDADDARAAGQPSERDLSSDRSAAAEDGAAEPALRSTFDNSENGFNGRPVSDNHR